METDEPEKAFHDIRLYQDDPIYVQLEFKDAKTEAPYLAIIEDNPYEGLDLKGLYGMEAQELLSHSELEFKRDALYKAIDKALEEGNREAFLLLSFEFNNLTDRKQVDD